MTEEQVTKTFLAKLITTGWEIVCFDFPQSGTGKLLHPNDGLQEKNLPSINPDIVAYRGGVCLFFENKDRFYVKDFYKQNTLKSVSHYSSSIESLLGVRCVKQYYFGIGLPSSKYKKGAIDYAYLVDFVFGISESFDVESLYNPFGIII